MESSETGVLEVLNETTLERWNKMKYHLSCRNDEEFVVKLLDIAEEFLNRYLFYLFK